MTTIRRAAAFTLAAALLGTGAAHAQDPRLLHRLDSATLAAVGSLMDSARADGLPIESLVQRALEGAAKHAEPDRIIGAVRRLAGELGVARAALGRESSPAELDAGASALRAGVRPEDLTLLRQRRTRSLTVALAALTDLVVGGVPPDSAASAVLALAARARDDQITDFRRAVERDIALGASPASAAAVRVDAAVREITGATANSANTPRKP